MSPDAGTAAEGADGFKHSILLVATPDEWVVQACANQDVLLIDHANCEKKAASTALSLMFAYAEDLSLTDKMSRLAREELRHYEQVVKLVKSLKVLPQRLSPGRYAERMRRLVAKAEPQREVDLMICGAFIEARSCERFAALAPVIGGDAGRLFHGLHAAEARHFQVYLAAGGGPDWDRSGAPGGGVCGVRGGSRQQQGRGVSVSFGKTVNDGAERWV